MIMSKTNAKNVFFNALTIILAIILLAGFIFLSYRLIDCRIEDLSNSGQEHYCGGFAFMAFACTVILASVNLAIFLVLILIYLIYKKSGHASEYPKELSLIKGLMILPFASQTLFAILTVILGRIK